LVKAPPLVDSCQFTRFRSENTEFQVVQNPPVNPPCPALGELEFSIASTPSSSAKMSQLLKEDPKKVAQLLTYAATFPDFPKNFVPPSLTDPNYVPPNKSQSLLIYAYFMIGFTTLVVALRLWIRKRARGMVFGLEDYLIIPGQVCEEQILQDLPRGLTILRY
jgi:hypothetical protein